MIPRTMEIKANEVALGRALVAVVVGSQPCTSSPNVKVYLESRFGVEPGLFLVYPHYSEDFLVIFIESITMFQVLRAPVPQDGLRLVFKRWRHEVWASAASMDFRLQVALVDVPTHLWLQSTTQEILGSSCNIIAMAPETESKATLKEFKVTVGCIHPDLLPLEKVMVTPIPATRPNDQPCLHYKAIINILELEDLRSAGNLVAGRDGGAPCRVAVPGASFAGSNGHAGGAPSRASGALPGTLGGSQGGGSGARLLDCLAFGAQVAMLLPPRWPCSFPAWSL